MKHLPHIEDPLVVRTDFSDDVAWNALCEAVRREDADGFTAYVELLSDPEHDGLAPDDLRALVPPGWDHSFVLVADRVTLSHPEHPLVAMDLLREPGRTFRLIPSQTATVANNLAIANADFVDYAESVDDDGVYRGSRGY